MFAWGNRTSNRPRFTTTDHLPRYPSHGTSNKYSNHDTRPRFVRFALGTREMSASPASTVLPPDQVLVAALRKVVQDGFRAGEVDQLSINHVRAAAEAKLGLRRGCLKGDDRWREESKEIIRAEFVRVIPAQGLDRHPLTHHPCRKRTRSIATMGKGRQARKSRTRCPRPRVR